MAEKIVLWLFYIMIGVLALFIYLFTCDLLINISNYFKRKDTITLSDKISTSDDILRLVIELVDSEIEALVAPMMLTGKKYNMLNMDKDIERLSKKVWDSLKPEVYRGKQIVFTEDCIIAFIITEMTLKLSATLKQYNLAILEEKE